MSVIKIIRPLKFKHSQNSLYKSYKTQTPPLSDLILIYSINFKGKITVKADYYSMQRKVYPLALG